MILRKVTHPEIAENIAKFCCFLALLLSTVCFAGGLDGYASRLHYTSEWIRQGESRGVFEEITGDIVCFDQNTAGLDIAHVAFALREGDKLTFIHASSKAGKVIVNSVPLLEYTRGIKSHDGLRVVRLK